MGGAKNRESLEENLFLSSRDLILRQRFTFQQDIEPQPTAKATLDLRRNVGLRENLI